MATGTQVASIIGALKRGGAKLKRAVKVKSVYTSKKNK